MWIEQRPGNQGHGNSLTCNERVCEGLLHIPYNASRASACDSVDWNSYPQKNAPTASHSCTRCAEGCLALSGHPKVLQELAGYLAHNISFVLTFPLLWKTEVVFSAKVSRINNRRCVEPLENITGRQQAGECGAAGTMCLSWQSPDV